MESQFFTSFLMISDWRTVLFLAVLAVLFGLIHYLYHKRKMGFSLVVCVGMVAGAAADMAAHPYPKTRKTAVGKAMQRMGNALDSALVTVTSMLH